MNGNVLELDAATRMPLTILPNTDRYMNARAAAISRRNAANGRWNGSSAGWMCVSARD